MAEERQHSSDGGSFELLSYKIDELRKEVAALKTLQEKLVDTVNRVDSDISTRVTRLEGLVSNAKTSVIIFGTVSGIGFTAIGLLIAFYKLITKQP